MKATVRRQAHESRDDEWLLVALTETILFCVRPKSTRMQWSWENYPLRARATRRCRRNFSHLNQDVAGYWPIQLAYPSGAGPNIRRSISAVFLEWLGLTNLRRGLSTTTT